MDVFGIKDDESWHEITRTNFEKKTDRRPPYYQTINKEPKNYAECPVCKNPIIVVNLYLDHTVDHKKRVLKAHGRHKKGNVNGFTYDEVKYKTCILSNPADFGSGKRVDDAQRNNRLIELIHKYKGIIGGFMRNYTGIGFSDTFCKEIIDEFIDGKKYEFDYVNEYNLPFTILYMSDSNNLFGRYINDENIISTIQEHSNHYSVNNKGQLLSIDISNRESKIEFYFSDFKIGSEQEPSQFTMYINEFSNHRKNELYSKDIEINQRHFVNTKLRQDREDRTNED